MSHKENAHSHAGGDEVPSTPEEMFGLAERYFANGKIAQALKSYKLSAKQGCMDAQFKLARMYEEGDCLPISRDDAMNWYEKAATQGHTEAQFRLGKMNCYRMNYPEAARWYRLAAAEGHEEARKMLGLDPV